MKTVHLVLAAAALAGAGCAASTADYPRDRVAYDDSSSCLRNNRVWGFSASSPNTLRVTDQRGNGYTVHMGGGCVNLNNAVTNVELLTRTSLGCLEPGDRVAFVEPSLGRLTCFVQS